MASISTDPQGLRRLHFTGPDGKRRTVHLGKTPQRSAEGLKYLVETILAAKGTSDPITADTARRIAELPDKLVEKLAAAGLVQPRRKSTLGPFLDDYAAKRTDVKGATRVFYGHTRRNLVGFFGADKPLREITAGDADDFRRSLLDQGLSAATVARRCSLAKTFLHDAVRHELVDRNPFERLKGAVRGNKDRLRFIDRETIDRIIAAAPDAEWRLLIALARYGGLRTPSESLSLRWGDIDWERDRFTVTSPKTEHHEGGESREVPLFPELRPYLQDAWDLAKPVPST